MPAKQKKKKTPEKNRQWRVLPILGSTRRGIAASLEKSFNTLTASGYHPTVIDVDGASYVFGELGPLSLQQGPNEVVELDDDISDILSNVLEFLRSRDPAAPRMASAFLKSACATIKPERLHGMCNEVGDALRVHKCSEPDDCLTSKTLGITLKYFQEYLRQNAS